MQRPLFQRIVRLANGRGASLEARVRHEVGDVRDGLQQGQKKRSEVVYM